MNLSDKIKNYVMSDQTLNLVKNTDLLLVAGVVSAGKDTTVNELLKSDRYYNIISHTTRQPRENHGILERDTYDYFFVDLAEAEHMVDDQAFIETKYVHGNVYGTSAIELQRAHDQQRVAVTDIDIEGVIEYLDVKPETHAVFLLPPSVETWLRRLTRRYGDLSVVTEELDKRFANARDEITKAKNDQRFIMVVNDDLMTTVKRIQAIVDGAQDQTSDYALEVADHLLDYLNSR